MAIYLAALEATWVWFRIYKLDCQGGSINWDMWWADLKIYILKYFYLKEIDITATKIKQVQWSCPSQVIHDTYNGCARGSWLFHKTIPFDLTNTIQDPQGSFGVAQGRSLSFELNLYVYGPNEDSPSIFEDFFLTLSFVHSLNIIGGILIAPWTCQ